MRSRFDVRCNAAEERELLGILRNEVCLDCERPDSGNALVHLPYDISDSSRKHGASTEGRGEGSVRRTALDDYGSLAPRQALEPPQGGTRRIEPRLLLHFVDAGERSWFSCLVLPRHPEAPPNPLSAHHSLAHFASALSARTSAHPPDSCFQERPRRRRAIPLVLHGSHQQQGGTGSRGSRLPSPEERGLPTSCRDGGIEHKAPVARRLPDQSESLWHGA